MGDFIQGYLKQVYTINHKFQVQGIADTTACLVIMIILPKLCQLNVLLSGLVSESLDHLVHCSAIKIP